jgi:hypothetical protein
MARYRDFLRDAFSDLILEVEDLLLLEDFQIEYLREGAPRRELAAVLWAYPSLRRFLPRKHRPIEGFIREVMDCRAADVQS